MTKKFYKEDIVNELNGFIAQSIVFSCNGVRIWARMILSHNGEVTDYLVERLGDGLDEPVSFFTLRAAALYAESIQR